jgi:hypothetical protein
VPQDADVGRIRWADLLAAVAAGEAVVAVGGAVVVGLSLRDAVGSYLVTNLAIGLSSAPCGFLVARHRPDNPIGRLLLVLAVAPLTSAAAVPVGAYGAAHDWPSWALRLTVTVFLLAWPRGVTLCLPLVLQLFPTGAPVSARWRPMLLVTVLSGLASVVAAATGPSPDLVADTFLLLGELPAAVYTAEEALAAAVLLAAVLSLGVRYRRGDETVRRQLLWLLLAAMAAIVINLPGAIDVAHRSLTDIQLC